MSGWKVGGLGLRAVALSAVFTAIGFAPLTANAGATTVTVDCSQIGVQATTWTMIALDDISIPVPAPYALQGQCALADFNGDGKLDLLNQTATGDVNIFYQTADGKYRQIDQRIAKNSFGLSWSAQNAILIIEDLNRDGKADIQLSSKDNGGLDAILLADSKGYFSKVSQSWSNYAEYDSPTASAVGASALSSSVSSHGGASYTLPITLPPGIGGMQPGLGVTYNSQGGNGQFGMRWSLSGLSAISRCNKNAALDGVPVSVLLNISDAYCLDGQRLVLVSGSHGTAGAQYRTEIDTLSKVTIESASATGANSFLVITKTGTRMHYGVTADSRLVAPGKTVVVTWALNRVEDRYTNYMLYTYDATSGGGLILSEIKYTGNTNSGILPTRKIAVTTEARTDIRTYFIGDDYFIENRRVTRIKTYVRDQLVRNYQFNYEYSPDTKLSRIANMKECGPDSCLQPITLTWQPGGTIMDALSWGGSVCSESDFTYGNCDTTRIWNLDLNNDGSSDICYRATTGIKCFLSSPNGGWDISTYISTSICGDNSSSYGQCNDADNYDTIQFADLNADGKLDLVFRSDNEGVKRFLLVKTHQYGKWVFGSPQANVPSLCYNGQNEYIVCDQSDNHPFIHYPDVNGDGYADICIRSDNSGIICYPGSATTWDISKPIDSGGTCSNSDSNCDYAGSPADNYPTIQYIDLNADGLSDVVYRGNSTGITRMISNGTGFTHQQSTGLCADSGSGYSNYYGVCNSWENYQTIKYTDINGDGYPDLCYRGTNGVNCFLGSAKGFDLAKGINTTICKTGDSDCNDADNYETIQYADMNGDGRTDLIVRGDDGVKYWIYDNGTFSGETRLLAKSFPGAPTNDLKVCQNGSTNFNGCDWKTMRIVDANGDGRPDIVFRSSKGMRMIANEKKVPDLMTRIQTSTYGAGVFDDLIYKPMTDFSQHLAIATYPIQVVAPRIPVVTVRKIFDGQHTEEFKYSYGVARRSITRGSYLGPNITTISNVTRGTSVQTYFNTDVTDFPYSGQVSSVYENVGGNQSLNVTVNTWKAKGTVGAAKVPYLSSVQKSIRSLNTDVTNPVSTNTVATSTTTTVVNDADIDQYGNAKVISETKVDSATGNTYTTTTNISEILNDTNNWCIGLPQKISVTKTIPNSSSVTRTTRIAYDPITCAASNVTIEPDSATLWSKRSYGYDSFGNRNSTTVTGASTWTPSATIPFGQRTSTTTYTYDGYFPEMVINAKGHTEHRVYDAASGQILTLTGPKGLTTRQIYNSIGRHVKEERADGSWSQTRLAVCDSGCLAGQAYYIESSAAGVPNTYRYFDASGREVRAITTGQSNGYIWKDTQYSVITGERIGQTAPYFANGETAQWGCIKLDMLGRTIGESLSSVGRTTCAGDIAPYLATYKYAGNTVEKTTTRVDTKNVKTSIVRKETRNLLGQLTRVDEATTGDSAESTSTKYVYDAVGDLTNTIISEGPLVTTPATAITTNMGYNLLGQKTSMQDPDKGSWAYYYNVIGELIWQQDGMGYITTQSYDALGRLAQRVERGEDVNVAGYETTNWIYDTAANGVGSLAKEENLTTGFARTYTYDGYGRPTEVINRVQNVDYSIVKGYDTYGRVSTISYPDLNGARYVVANEYDGNGYLKSVKNNSTGEVYWTQAAAGVNAAGLITNETLGNSLDVTRYFDPATGRLANVWSGALQDNTYVYDNLGNLESREDKKRVRIETFTYDQLNRLKTASVGGVTINYGYDILGNIKNKSDYGSTYLYGENGAGPHAVTTVKNGSTVLASYQYDKNGNMTGGAGRTITYTSFGQPRSVSQGGSTLTFASYAADRSRVAQTTPSGYLIYVNPRYDVDVHYEMEIENGAAKHSHYLYGGSGLIGVHTRKSNGEEDVNYFLKDHLGSVEVVTTRTGVCKQRFAYDAFGKQTVMNCAFGITNSHPETHHGYTGHELLESAGLIHMNGRLYDPVLGRMVQADSIFSAPGYAQSYNRYSYVMNNPMVYWDPAGFWRISLSLHVGVGFHFSYNSDGDHIRGGVGVGIGAGASVGVGKVNLGGGADAYMDVGYDNRLKNHYVTGVAYAEIGNIGINGSATLYGYGRGYQIGAGVGSNDGYGLGVGYSEYNGMGGWYSGVNVKGVAANYDKSSNSWDFSANLSYSTLKKTYDDAKAAQSNCSFCNGYGDKGGNKVKNLLIDVPGTIFMGPEPAVLHDYGYGVVGMSQGAVDGMFFTNMVAGSMANLSQSDGLVRASIGMLLSPTYWAAVHFMGGAAYKAAQREAMLNNP